MDENQHDTNQLPEWARDALTKANREAASYRVAAKNARDDVRAEIEETVRAEYAERLAAIEAREADTDAKLQRWQVALAAEAPAKVVPLIANQITGSTPEEMAESAEALVTEFSAAFGPKRVPAVDPSQGATGNGNDYSTGDPIGDLLRKR